MGRVNPRPRHRCLNLEFSLLGAGSLAPRVWRGTAEPTPDSPSSAGYTLKQHRHGVLRWFTSNVNSGLLEAINGLIQAAKARARGYRTTRNFISVTYLIAGKLKFDLPT